jgi:ribonucleoside-diphosphate reductase alpha chain
MNYGTNPCVEVSLLPNQFCNLTECNVSNVKNQKDLEDRVRAAAFLGTLQASYTNFHYLRPIWKETTEREALIGVSMTGIASNKLSKLNLEKASDAVIKENKRVAKLIGINFAARCTVVKPAGTTSLVLGSSSGIHAWHNEYYVRRMRIGKGEPLYNYIKTKIPDLIEDCKFKPNTEAVLSIPQKAPLNAITRAESYLDLLERVKKYNLEWVKPGHNSGDNTNNVSCTISLKDDEWDDCANWMWDNRFNYNGIAVFPYDGGTYVQAPFEDITKEKFYEMLAYLKHINLLEVVEFGDFTNHKLEPACAGNACEI